MSWKDASFMVVWGALGLWAWFRAFKHEFRFQWWWTASFGDKIMMCLLAVGTFAFSIAFGPLSFVAWRTNDPRNYR